MVEILMMAIAVLFWVMVEYRNEQDATREQFEELQRSYRDSLYDEWELKKFLAPMKPPAALPEPGLGKTRVKGPQLDYWRLERAHRWPDLGGSE